MAFAKRQKNIRQNISCSVLLTQHTLSIDILRFGVLLIFVLATQTFDASLIFCSSSIQCKEENAESHDEHQNSNDSKKVSDTQAETNNSSQINDNNDNEEDSNSDDLDEDKPDPYSFESDEDENANNSTLGDDGEESIKAEEIEDPAGVR